MGVQRIPSVNYSEAFKVQMVRRLTGPGGPSATGLSREVGVHQCTLSRWVREAHVAWQGTPTTPDEPERAMPARRPQDWTAEEKYAVMIEAASLSDEELGASKARSSRPSTETRRIRELERELARKEKALAEAAALLLLEKKAQALWGAEDDTTALKKGRRS